MQYSTKPIYLLLLIILLISAFSCVNYFLSNKIEGLTKNKYLQTSNSLKNQIKEAIFNKKNSTFNVALALSEDNNFKKFLKNEKVPYPSLNVVSEKIKKYSNFKNLWIHLIDKNGISKYRSWTKEKNDNVSTIRKELPTLLKNPKVVSIISVGIFDITFKNIVPIYDGNQFLGLVEVITKMNSIAEEFKEKGIDLIILADKEFKNQIKKPFTKDFIGDYYVANLDAKSELKKTVKENIDEFLSIKDYKLIDNHIATTFTLKNEKESNIGYFIIFKQKKEIDLNDIYEFDKFIKFIGILLTLAVIAIFSSIHFYNKSKYTTELEKNVKRRTQELNELTKKYHQIFEGSKAIKIIYDPITLNIIDINASAINFYGYKRADFINLKANDISMSTVDKQKKEFINILENRQNVFISKNILSNGEIKDVEIYASAIQIDKKTFVYSIIRDITDELKEKNEFNKKQKLFYQQAKMASMGEMLENIAHQWRQPLSTITTAASGAKIKKEFGDLDDEFFYDSVDLIIRAATYLSQTIDDFRDFFKQSKNKENFKLSTLINTSIKLANIKNTDIEIVTVYEDCEILGYKNELIQVFLNIFSNAKDILNTTKSVNKLIKIEIEKTNNNITFSILDNAGGIKESDIEKVFEPYFTTKHKSQGTGIGLYMSEQIITKHFGGEINVQNINFLYKDKEYFGANFKIKIPISLNS
ncbi:ATP-binding protein [Arcobacter sp.]|uniref:PAS domain-containing sensor histidine kinase n=1 Tax=unclassified Arcobacter TaxID=2593671 RepID=UPI003AFFFAD7